MIEENSLFSFFTNIKDRISSYFCSVSHSSKKDTQNLLTNMDNKFFNPTEEKNNMTYLMKNRNKRISNYFNKRRFSKEYNHSYSLNEDEDSNKSLRLSELSSKEEMNLDDAESNFSEEYDYMLTNSNNYIHGEQDFKNNYRNNSFLLGQKISRNFFNENIYNKEEDEYNYYQNNNCILPEIKRDKIVNCEYRKNKKEKKLIKKRKISKIGQNMNYKDIKRISNEYSSYKAKLKYKNKINNNFLQQIKNNEQIIINSVNKNERVKEINKLPFDNLTFTHPERFSFYSTQKKLESEKNVSKGNKKPNLFSITIENDINIIPSLDKNIENKNEVKPFNKNSGSLNISPVKSCESFKISNVSKDFTFGESYESIKTDNEITLSQLLNENNNDSSIYKHHSLDKNNNIFSIESQNNNNSLVNRLLNGSSFNSNNNNSNSQDYFMDIDEHNLNKDDKQNTNKKEKESNIIPITRSNNPFLVGNNINKNNKDNNKNNINSNIPNNAEFFKGSNLFNINGNNNNESKALNFSFGKA